MKKTLILLLALIIPVLITAKTDFDYRLDKPTHLYIGTPFHLIVNFKTGLQDSIFSPKIDTLDIFILKKIRQSQNIENNIKTTTVDMEFAPFDTGSHNFPPIEFSVKTKKDSVFTFKTPQYNITVESVITDTTKVIKDIKSPLKLRLSFWEILLPIVLLLAVILTLIYLIRKKPTEQKSHKKKKKLIPAYINALNLLNKLANKKLLENGEYLQYFFELSYILRYFLEGYYNINAVEMTTSEIKSALGNVENRSQIMALLNYADRVKFAKFVPTYEDGKKFENWLKDYLNEIKKIEEKKLKEEIAGDK